MSGGPVLQLLPPGHASPRYAKKPLPIRSPGVSFLGTLTWGNPFLRSAMATTVMDLVLVGKVRIPNCTLH